jgi:hypothetical protein
MRRTKTRCSSANLRDFLGARKVSGNVNTRIKQTAEQNPGEFFVLNNGITIVTKKAVLDDVQKALHIHGVSVVNGAQTTGAVHAAGPEHAKNVSVLARIITVDSPAMISEIVAGNNTQNSIVAWDRRSNDPVQIRIKQEFQSKAWITFTGETALGNPQLPLTLDESDFLERLTLQIAIAIENARNHELIIHLQRVEQDLASARAIQHSLLPSSVQAVTGYKTAIRSISSYEVGGDYLDLLRLPSGE